MAHVRRMTAQAMNILWWLAIALFVAEGCFLFLFRQINQDEGWYLWAGKLVLEGKVLYRDFAFPQSPLLPYFYGIFQHLLGQGLYQGRLITTLIAVLNLILGIRLARRLGGREAILPFLLLQISTLVAAAFQLSYIAPYALATCFLTLSLLCCLSDLPETPRVILVVCLWALATGTRLSAAIVIVPLALYLLVTSKRRWRTVLVVLISALAALGIIFGPFLLTGREVMLYDIFGFHTDRMLPEWQLRAMRRSLSNFVTDFPIPFALGCTGLVLSAHALWHSSGRRQAFWRLYPALTVGMIVLALLVAHLVPRTTDSFYNALQMPLLSVLGSLVLVRVWRRALHGQPMRRQVTVGLLAIMVLLNAAQQTRVMLHRGLVTIPPVNQIELARDAALFLRENTPPGGRILTFENFLALEADRDIPPGFEMSVFAYQPTWSTERARRYRVVNNELLLEAMHSNPAAAAFSVFNLDSLYGERDMLLTTLQEEFRWVKTIPGLGPTGDDLRIYLPPQFDPPKVQFERIIPFARDITFLGYDLNGRKGFYRAGEQIDLTLYWRALATPQQEWTVFTHVLGPGNAVITGYDNPPCLRTCPTTTWRPKEVIRDEYLLRLPPDLDAGRYQLEIGLYDAATGVRLPLQQPSADEGDRILLAPITVAAMR